MVIDRQGKFDKDRALEQKIPMPFWSRLQKGEVIEQYKKLNEAIGSLQTSLITGHEFLKGERVADADEIEADKIAAEKQAEETYQKQLATLYKNAVADYRKRYENGEIPAGTKIEFEVPEKAPAVPVVGGAKKDADGKVIINEKTGTIDYTTTKYTSDDGSIVKVTYGDSVSFIINYNNFKVTVWDADGTEYVIDSYSFVKIN